MFQTPFTERKPIGLRFSKPSLTQQQFAADADINRLVQRFLRGDMSVLASQGQFADVSDSPCTLHDLMTKRANANTAWLQLPEQVRASYGSPERFLAAYDSWLAAQNDNPAEKSDEKSDATTTVTPSGAKTA